MFYNSEIAVKGLGITLPTPKDSRINTSCACCGRPIAVGDPYQPIELKGDSFMDDAWFTTRSGVSCPACNAMMSSKVSKKLGSCNSIVYTRDGAYPIANDIDRTWFLLTPPKGPFVVTASGTINFQHVIWKTPVTLSHDMIYVGWPSRIMTIRHKTLMKAVKVCGELTDEVMLMKAAAAAAKKGAKPPKKNLSHPYISLTRNLDDLQHAAFRPDIMALASANQNIADGLNFLKTLSLGETWALSTLVKAKPDTPVKPEKLILPHNALL